MRKLAPLLTIALVVAGFYFALEGPRARETAPQSRPAASGAESRAESRPESAASETRAESSPETSPVEEVVILEVVREDGTALAEASLVIQSDTVDEVEAKTDARGRAEVAARAGESGTLTITPRTGAFPISREIPMDSGTVRIVVPTGLRVAGVMTIGGLPPAEPVVLDLATSDSGPEGIMTTTDAAGAFEFYGLAPGWSGELTFPLYYRRIGDPEGKNLLELAGPDPGVVLRLEERPAIKGRVLRGTPPIPTKGAEVRYSADRQGWLSTGTDGQGRFRIIVWSEVSEVQLDVVDHFGLGKKLLEVQGPMVGVRDLGDIMIGDVRNVPFIVRTAESKPVAGAVAKIEGTESWSMETDADGRSSIIAEEVACVMAVGKLGFAIAKIDLIPEAPVPVEVVLQPGNQLRIEVRLPDNTIPPANSVFVHLRAEDPVFGGPVDSHQLYGMTGASWEVSVRPHEDGWPYAVDYSPAGGTVVTAGFLPGAQFSLYLRSRMFDVILAEAYVVMDAVGTKTVTLRAERMPQVFSGVVRQTNGVPIPEAWVVLGRGRPEDVGLRTTAEGTFELTHFYSTELTVRIAKEGFVTVRRDAVPVPAPGTVLDFVMTPGLRVDVELVDERGALVLERAEVYAGIQGFPDWAQPENPEPFTTGLCSFTDLPDAVMDLTAVVGTTQVLVTHDTRYPVARITVPTEGGVEIHYPRLPDDPAQCRYLVQALRGGANAFEGDVPNEVGDHSLEAHAPPGRYVVIVEGFDEDTDEWFVLATSVAFDVVAHDGVIVEIRR